MRARACRFKIKAFAIYAAPFQNVLALDSDSMPAVDPAQLFKHPSYKEHGNMFWPDCWCLTRR